MADTPEVIRQQMAETRSQLSDKLESLESQVSETVQSTGSAVNATVGAVQETVESVTGAVQDAMKSVSNAFDVGSQISRHPWLVLGGSVVLGYLAVDLLDESGRSSKKKLRTSTLRRPSADTADHRNGTPTGEFQPAAAAILADRESRSGNSPWHQLTSAATGALIGIVQDAAARVVPQVMDYLNRSNVPGPPAASGFPASQKRKCSTMTTLD